METLLNHLTIMVWFYKLAQDPFSEKGKSVHIAVDKSHNQEFLLKAKAYKEETVAFQLTALPRNSPHYLDDEHDPICNDEDSFSFEALSIGYAADKSKIRIQSNNPRIEFHFTSADMELFSRLMRRSLEYCDLISSDMDITVVLDEREIKNSELLVWGFYNGKPVYL